MELICFDMDHTLIRTNKVHLKAFYMAFKKHSLPKVKTRKVKLLFGMVGEELVRTLFPNLSKRKVDKVLTDHNHFVIEKTSKYVHVIRGVKGMLKKLKKDYKLALLSNASHEEIIALLKHGKINLELFDVILGSHDIKNPKPHPEIINKAKKITKCEVGWMVGDSIWDMQAGKRAKMKTVAVLTGNQGRDMLIKEKPDYILKSVAKLPKVLKKSTSP